MSSRPAVDSAAGYSAGAREPAANIMNLRTGTISDSGILLLARTLRAVSWVLEIVMYAATVGSVLAFGGVHEFAYVPLWWTAALLAVLLALRSALVATLRRRLGNQRFSFHVSGRWLVLGDEPSAYGISTWSCDLAAPRLVRGPLALPLLAAGFFVVLQLVPLPAEALPGRPASPVPQAWVPITVSVSHTLRGLCFLATFAVLHLTAATLLERHAPRDRLRKVLTALALVLALVGLAQKASGSGLIYGFFEPLEAEASPLVFGPFVNRNHFAGYMLMVVPICMSFALRAYGRYRRRVGGRANWLRSWAVALQSPEGIDFVYALVPALAAVAALIAANSRGGLLAFLGSMAIAVVAFRGRVGIAGVVPVAFVVMGLSWFGLERIGNRFMTAFEDSVGRTTVWQDSIARIDGYWLAGSGFNTFSTAMSRTSVWRLPEGATPWRPDEAVVVHTPQRGYRVPEGVEKWIWYREAHNDYVQVFVEMGVVGLAIVLWAAVAVLRRVAPDPWLLAAVTGVMLHSLVDFDLQIPALAVLFAVISAMPPTRLARRPKQA